MRRNDGLDLLLLHPPSVYDFREKAIFYGPISDAIPSSPVFEMYPLGFLTIASYLEARGMNVRIVNLAVRMMNEPRFSVPRFLELLRPRAVGIDLHWLPHAHGALEVARIVKEIHPDIPVIMGGLSSTYSMRNLSATHKWTTYFAVTVPNRPCISFFIPLATAAPCVLFLISLGRTADRRGLIQ